MNDVLAPRPVSTGVAKIIYVLYLLGVVTFGSALVIGVVMAYVYKDDAPDWLRTHYELQIRTFWIGLLYCIIAGVLALLLIGFLLFLLIGLWVIIRSVKGLRYVDQNMAYPDPRTWLF